MGPTRPKTSRFAKLLPGMEGHREAVRQTHPAQRQEIRQDLGRDLAETLAGSPLELVYGKEGAAIINPETGEELEDRAAAFAALLMLGAEDSNHVVGALAGEGLEPFIAGLSLWNPSLRLDPNWMEAMRRRSRKTAKGALRRMMEELPDAEKMARRYGWKQRLTLKLITLTMPHLQGRSTLEEVGRINAAMQLLRKRGAWLSQVWGGVKGVEDKLSAAGPHVHVHALVLSRFIDHGEISEAWRECVDAATRKAYGFGLAEDCPNPFVDVRQVRKRLKPGQELRKDLTDLDSALNEVTKYITKTADLTTPDAEGRRIPREWLLELCEVRRWPRMFELLGKARKPAAQGAALDLIHRAYLAAPGETDPLRMGWALVEAWDHDLDGPEELRLAIVEKLKKSERPPPEKRRPPSWRDLLDVLPFRDWLAHVVQSALRGRKFRIAWTLEHNPGAQLWDFTGLELA